MCGICGCSAAMIDVTQDPKAGSAATAAMHSHSHMHAHTHDHEHSTLLTVEQNLMAYNQQFADANRAYFLQHHITTINLMSSPGTGKTSLLTKTLHDLAAEQLMGVVVGDQHTDFDAQQLQTSGALAIQINTGHVCHLDAHRLGHVIEDGRFDNYQYLLIENVGNLVCPALFDLGEQYRVVLLSVTEGDNKPLKYPDMFRHADLMLITKMDLLPYVDFDVEQCIRYAQRIQPQIKVLTLSTKTGAGLDTWYQWLLQIQPT